MDRGERALSDAERSEVVASDFDPGAVFGPFESAPRKPRRDDVVECTATALDGRGRTVGRVGSYRLVLEGALPGDRVRAVVSRRRGERVEARASSILVPSRDRVEPRCAHVHDCGGCRFQELAYARQLAELASAADERLAPLVRFGLVLDEIVGAEDPWRYRNKMDLTFASRRWVERDDDGRRTDFALGMHARGRHDKVVDVGACWLQGDVGDRVVASARARALELGVPPWDLVAHEGFLRHLVVRRGVRTGEWLVYVVTSTDEEPRFERWWRGLLDDVPEITTLVHGATARLSSVAIGDVDTVLHGAGTIRERLGGIEFTISPRSFFQTNTAQAERLVDIVRSFAGTGGVLWDLYCGAGLFGLALAGSFERVFGVESVGDAVRDANANAARNAISNTTFVEGDAMELLASAGREGGSWPAPDVCVVDPPRAGLHPAAVEALVRIGPPRLVLVSCHLESGARDLVPMLEGGYALRRAALVDLFPHTPHLEGVFLLERAT